MSNKKNKWLIGVCLLSLCLPLPLSAKTSSFYDDQDGCEIKIVNKLYDDVIVSGYFDYLGPLMPFTIYRDGYDAPHYIGLYYADYFFRYCHRGMTLRIATVNGYELYAGYARAYSTIWLMPPSYLSAKPRAEIKTK